MASTRKRRKVPLACIALSIVLLGGCATNNPRDPFEPVNRGIYQFNEGVDKAILKPVAQAYRAVLPQFVRSSVSNFFSNINDVVVALNNLLQGKFTTAYSDFGRIAINTTLGLGGLFDVASEAGIEKHEEDFGQTLGWWGIEDGPFLMLPLFGPSTVRDGVGRFVDYKTDLVTYVYPYNVRNILWGTRLVNRRSELLDASTVLQTAALDPYEFVRDAYLQRRRNLIYDGAPPPDKEFMDPPPSPKNTRRPGTSFPAAAEPSGPGSILVSGEDKAPVLSASLAESQTIASKASDSVSAAQSNSTAPRQSPPAWFKRESPGWYSGQPLTPAELDALEQPQQQPMLVAASQKQPQHSMLVRLWRSLIP
ncbi:MAG: MlaA family lipoprotein [Burkholderiales bacterium]